jgi:hypothetical protein
MSDEPSAGQGLPAPEPAGSGPGDDLPAHLRARLRSIAVRLRDAADNLGGELMVELPSRLGDHEGLLLALANELEQLVK